MNDDINIGIGANYTGQAAIGRAISDLSRVGQAGAGVSQSAAQMSAATAQIQQKFDSLAQAVARGNITVEQAAQEWVNFKQALPDDELRRVAEGVEDVAQKSQRAKDSIGTFVTGLKSGIDLIGQAVQKVGQFIGGVVDTLVEGADLDAAAGRFERLAATIGETGDALVGKLREATRGMISDAGLIASASDIISLKLGDSADQVVRISTVAGLLNLDMQQLVLTFANLSTMRLDALGLSVTDVKNRQKELMQAGLDTAAAFKEAVVQGLEARVELLGDASQTSAGQIKQLQASWENTVNAFKVAFAQSATEELTELTGSVEQTAASMEAAATRAGQITGKWISDFTIDISQLIIILDKLSRDPRGFDSIVRALARANPVGFLSGDILGDLSGAILREEAPKIAGAAREAGSRAGRAFSEGIAEGAGQGATALSEWTAEAKEAAIEAGNLAGELAGIEEGLLAGANQAGIWAAANASISATLNAAFEGTNEVIDEYNEKVREAIEETRDFYAEMAARGGDTFIGQIELPAAEQLFPSGGAANANAITDAIIGMADAAGASAPQLADLVTQMGEFDGASAEAAVKAAIFQEALGLLTQEWKLGNLDTSEFLSSVDELVTELETKTVAQIKVELAPPERSEDFQIPWGDDFTSFWPKEAQQIKIEADVSPVQEALTTAIGYIEGVPVDDRTIVVEMDGTAVDTGIEVATAVVTGFTSAEYMATVELNIDSVETGAVRATTLMAEIPEYKTVQLNFVSNLDDLISQLRAAGVIP
jgi:hypothetical protein